MWTSPGGLTRQVLLNEAGAAVLDFKHTIGHAAVRLDCAATPTRAAAKFAGAMTNANDADFRDMVLTEQVGLGVMFESVAGRLQDDAEIQADLDAAKQSGGMNYVRFGIDADVCQKLVDYAAEYRQRGIDKVYGLAVRPLYGEGAGCSAFAVSFLELGGLLEQRFRDAWSFHVRVPMWTAPLIGSPEPLIGGARNPGVKIPVTRVASLTRDWASPTEEGVDIAGWDPTQMNESIDGYIDDALAHPNGGAKVETTGKLRGLLLDRTKVAPSPALSTGNYFQSP